MHISAICPVFDTDADLVEAAVQSVMTQAGRHEIELILVDDNSSKPATRTAIDAIAKADGRVRLHRLSSNGGPAVARQAGVALSSNILLGFIDADDVWPADKLATAEAHFAAQPDLAWLSGMHTILRRDGAAPTGTSLLDACPHDQDDDAPVLHGLPLMRGLITAMPPLGASIMRRRLFDAAGGLDPALRYGEDWLLYLKMAKLAPMRFVRDPVYVLRRQRASMMQSEGRMSRLYLASITRAMREPMLAEIRRELGWYAYSACKDVAMNNALNNRPLTGLYYALSALSRDPREVREFGRYVGALAMGYDGRRERLKKYCTSDQIILDQLRVAA